MTDQKRAEEAAEAAQFEYSKSYKQDMHPTFHFKLGFAEGVAWRDEHHISQNTRRRRENKK